MDVPKFVAFDLEIADEFPEDGNWQLVRPLGISCAATYTSDGMLKRWRAPADVEGDPFDVARCEGGEIVVHYYEPYNLEGAPFPERMTPEHCRQMVDYLLELEERGYEVVTWNGLGFDFDILAEEVADLDYRNTVIELALRHVDPFFNMVCDKGFGIALNTAAQGLGVAGKTEGMHGDLAPMMWREGLERQLKVLEYVGQDAIATANVYTALRERGVLPWTTKRGTQSYWRRRQGMVDPVNRAAQWPKPDTSWMTRPRPRSSYYAWTGAEL
jgi:hypothetical protein